MRFAVRLQPYITAPPAAPVRAPVRVDSVVHQTQKAWCVPFHDEHELRVDLAQGPLCADVSIEPLVGYEAGVRSLTIAVVLIAADAGPRRGVIVVTVRCAWLYD